MKLRSQMLFAGALTLAVPLVGLQSVKQLYGTLQKTRIDEQVLKVANMRLALSDAEDVNKSLMTGLATADENDWYAQSSPYPMFVDGYADDWLELNEHTVTYSANNATAHRSTGTDIEFSVRVARRDDHLFLLLSVTDDEVIYHTPPTLRADLGEGELPDPETLLVNGDSLELLSQDETGEWQHALFRPIAPGLLNGLRASEKSNNVSRSLEIGRAMPGWEAAWTTENDGYALEIKLPLPESGSSIGVAVVDVDFAGEERTSWVGTLSPAEMEQLVLDDVQSSASNAGLLFHDSQAASDYLKRWTSPGVRARLFDVHGRLLADVDNLYEKYDASDDLAAEAESSNGLWDAILLRLFSFFVAGDLPLLPEYTKTAINLKLGESRRASITSDDPLTSRYVTEENDRVLGTLAPIGSEPRRGYLLFEANEEHASAYAGSEMARLYSLLLLVSLLAGSGLLIFAFVLSSRIRRLSKEAQSAISEDGKVHGLPGSDAQDEIGDLSRNLSSLLSKSASYTQYLEALSSRLSHELRTPLSVVRTSLENLDRESLNEESRQLIDRASGGADHLGSIIKALVESTRLEQSVQLAEKQRLDLVELLVGSLQRYQQVYSDRQFRMSPTPEQPVFLIASPELLQQALDKLVDNAVSFAIDEPIVLHLSIEDESSGKVALIGVANKSVLQKPGASEQWFDPLYSHREGAHAQPQQLNLGLGLYVVKIIAEAHSGTAFAREQQTANAVDWIYVGLSLPVEE